jgi:basic membrane protein A
MAARKIATAALMLCVLFLAACERTAPPAKPGVALVRPEIVRLAPPAAAPAAKYKIPEPVAGKFNAAFVYVGPVGDGGWTYAHDQGRKYLEKEMPDVATAYVESVAEGAEAEQVIRSLARKKFDLIVAASFGFMDACEEVAKEFPAVKFLHISGFKKNATNFGNLFGAMEDMKYLAGMIAGARAKADGKERLGYVAPMPIPEVVRLIDASALGMKAACPNCALEVRWVNSWFDPVKEKEAAESLLGAGADVVMTGNDTSGPIVAAGKAGKWSTGYNSDNACNGDPAHCLTVPYWNWGASYVRIVKAIKAGTWKPSDDYPSLKDNALGLLGFMENQRPAPGVPAATAAIVKERLTAMKEGKLTRFDIFKGPLKSNKGVEIVPAGKSLTQEDLEGVKGVAGRPDCAACMPIFVDGVIGEIPK